MNESPRGPAYRIETERLVLRCYQPADAPRVQAAVEASLDELRPWLPWTRHEPMSLSQPVQLLRQFRGQFDLGHDFTYGAFDPQETHLLGSTGLHTRVGPGAREIGYWICTGHTGAGLATEMVAALTRVGFELEQLQRIEIHCSPDNTRSATVARKLGYTHEATLRQRLDMGEGQLRDTMIWTLFAADYPQSPAASTRIRAYDAIEQRIL